MVALSALSPAARAADEALVPGTPQTTSETAKTEKVTLAQVFTSHMVLQADQPIHLWGDAPSGETLTASLGGQQATATADAEGHWSLRLAAMPASSKPATLNIRGKSGEAVLEDVLIGEVWLCAGQSNMEWGMATTPQGRIDMTTANIPALRLFSVSHETAKTPLRLSKVTKGWEPANPNSLKDVGSHHSFSATAFYFGRALQARLGVPVGLIETAWGGSPIEPWTPTGTKANYGDIFNGMVAPLTPLPVRGVIWYQGESNIKDRGGYENLMKELILQWRAAFSQPKLPFYFVEIAPYIYPKTPPEWLGELRAAQAKVAREIPATGMVHSLDIPDNITNIHPNNKIDVGKRLARLALAKTYGIMEGRSVCGPVATGFANEGSGLVISFEETAGSLKTTDGAPATGFEVLAQGEAGETWMPATAAIRGERITVSNPGKPIRGVRFCWLHDQQSNLRNAEDLPPSPFQQLIP